MSNSNVGKNRALALTPGISPVGPRRWRAFIQDDDLSCYSFYLPHGASNASAIDEDEGDESEENDCPPACVPFVPTSQLDEWFQALHPSGYGDEPAGAAWTDATYKNELLLRKTAWHTFDEECDCEYGYSDTWQPLIRSRKMMDVLEEITRAVADVVGINRDELNSVNLNYYPRGGGVGFHADDEFLFDGLNRKTRIVSLSLCSLANIASEDNREEGGEGAYAVRDFGARKFQVKQKERERSVSSAREIKEITLRHGDLMTMEGMFQKHYLHVVWPGDSTDHADHALCRGERINLTWRTIVRHLDGSDECRGLTCPLAGRKG